MTAKGDDWGPWIDHDGLGCPPFLVGKLIKIKFVLTANHGQIGGDDPGRKGDIVVGTLQVNERTAAFPEWTASNIGKVVECTYRPGVRYACPLVLAYRIRRDRAAEREAQRLADLIADVPVMEEVDG